VNAYVEHWLYTYFVVIGFHIAITLVVLL